MKIAKYQTNTTIFQIHLIRIKVLFLKKLIYPKFKKLKKKRKIFRKC